MGPICVKYYLYSHEIGPFFRVLPNDIYIRFTVIIQRLSDAVSSDNTYEMGPICVTYYLYSHKIGPLFWVLPNDKYIHKGHLIVSSDNTSEIGANMWRIPSVFSQDWLVFFCILPNDKHIRCTVIVHRRSSDKIIIRHTKYGQYALNTTCIHTIISSPGIKYK